MLFSISCFSSFKRRRPTASESLKDDWFKMMAEEMGEEEDEDYDDEEETYDLDDDRRVTSNETAVTASDLLASMASSSFTDLDDNGFDDAQSSGLRGIQSSGYRNAPTSPPAAVKKLYCLHVFFDMFHLYLFSSLSIIFAMIIFNTLLHVLFSLMMKVILDTPI